MPVEAESLSAWSPEEGKTYLYFSGTLNYVGDAKETVSYWCDAELDYNDGYIVVPEIVETDAESPLLLRFMLRIPGRGEIVNNVLHTNSAKT